MKPKILIASVLTIVYASVILSVVLKSAFFFWTAIVVFLAFCILLLWIYALDL